MDNSNGPSPLASSSGFFSKPEGQLGIWLPIGIVAAVIFFFGSAIGAFLVNALDNMLHFTIVGGILLAILFMAMDPKLRRAFFYGYRSLMRWLARVLLISKDPIGVRETYVEEAKKKDERLAQDIQNLRGQRINTQRKAAENKRTLSEQYAQAEIARNTNNARALLLCGHEIARRESLDRQYSEALTNYDKLLTVSVRYQQLCSDIIIDLQRDIIYRKEQQAFSRTTKSVVGNMRAILKGMPGKDMYDDAGEVLDDRYTNALGNVEDFTESMKDMLSGADLQDSAAVQAVIDRMEQREQALLAPPKVDTKDPPVAVVK